MTYLGDYIPEAQFGCHDIIILGESLIKLRQRPDMTITMSLLTGTLSVNSNIQAAVVEKPDAVCMSKLKRQPV